MATKGENMITVHVPIELKDQYTELYWKEGSLVEIDGTDYHIHSISTSLKHPETFKMELDEWIK